MKRVLLCSAIFWIFFSITTSFAQRTATQARHETLNQDQIVIRLNGNLAALFAGTAGWTVSVGGVPATVSNVIGANGSNEVTVTFSPAVGIGQTVFVSYTGGAAINAFTNLQSFNNYEPLCDDFTFAANLGSTPPCAPVDPQTIMVFSVSKRARNSSQWAISKVQSRVYWMTLGGAPNSFIPAYESDVAGNPVSNSYFVAARAADDPANFVYPGTESVCGYTSFWTVRISFNGARNCTASLDPNQRVIYASHNADDGNGDGQLAMNPLVINTDRVCEGQFVNMRFNDISDLNCIDDLAAPSPLPKNQQTRWVRVIYGAPVTGTTGYIPNVFVGAQQITDAAGNLLFPDGYSPTTPGVLGTPDGFGVVEVPPTVTGPRGALEPITTSTATPIGSVGKRLYVRLQYWNICNAYTTGDFSRRREIDRFIEVIDAPEPPAVSNIEICNSGTRTLTVSPVVPNTTYRWYLSLANANAGTPIRHTGSTFTPNSGEAPIGVTSFWVTATQGNGCTSPPREVTITRRNDISATPPSLVNPITQVCLNATNTYRLPNDPATEAVGGATEFFWSVSPAANATITGGQGTREITLKANSIAGPFTLSVVRRYASAPQCPSNARSTVITVFADPTTAPVNPSPICEGSPGITLNGNPGTPAGTTVASHLWTNDIAILSDPNIQNPGILTTAPAGTYDLTYTVTNNIGCSASANITVTIDANPALATVGPNQDICRSPLTSDPLGGSNPGVGTGTWSVQSKPLPAASIIFNSGVNSPGTTATASHPGIYVLRWTVVNNSCESFADITIDFGSNPTDPVVSDVQVCGESTNLVGNNPTIGAGTWHVINGPGGCIGGACPVTITNPTSPTAAVQLNGPAFLYGDYFIEWRIRSGQCPEEAQTARVTFSRPATATVPATFVACIDPDNITPISLSGTVGGGATQGRWECASCTGTFQNGGPLAGPTIVDQYMPSPAEVGAGTVQLRLVAIDPDGGGPCGDVSSVPLSITIDRKPNVADAGLPDAICDGETATLAAVPVTYNGVGTWSPAAGVADIHDPTTTVTGLTSNTTFTWTVKSALGALGSPPLGSCATTSDDVLITVHPLPAALDPHPSDLCQTTGEVALRAVGVTLSDYNDGVTGIAGSVQRTVKWYRSPANQISDVNPITIADIENGQVLFTRVIDTSTGENCDQLGQVTFTVNPKPTVVPQNLAFCEEFPAGSGRVNNIDLTTAIIKNNITNSATDRSIFWYTSAADAEADVNRVATPADVDIVGDSVVFARVVNDLTGCFNIAQVNLLVKPLPADQPILGSSTPCVNGTELYRVSQLSGAQYIWTIPPQFTPLGGGGLNDFYVLLEFPNAATADLKVQIVLNGCTGDEISKTVAVSSTPPGFSIVQPVGPICEEGTFAYSVSPNNTGSSSYSWEILRQSDGLPGGGVVANGQTTGSVLITLESQDVFIRVTESNASGCAGPSQQIPVTVRRRPTMDDRAEPVCGGDAIAITLAENATSPVVATSFEVQVPSILPGITPIVGPTTGIVGPNGIANDTYRNQTIAPVLQLYYRVKPISAAGCYGDEKSVILDIKAEPLLDANLGKTICSGVATGITLKTALGFLPADKYEISRIAYNTAKATPLTALPPTNVLLNNDAIALDRWENLTSDTAHITYYVRPFNTATGCYGNPPIPVLIIVQPNPLVTPLGTLPDICSGDVLNVTLTSLNIANPQFVWTISQVNGNITGATGNTSSTITDRLVNHGLTPGSVVYEIHATDMSSSPVCTGPAVFITVPVKPAPATQNITATVCSDTYGGNTYVEDLTSLEPQVSSEAGVTYTWFTNQGDFAGSQIAPALLSAYPLTNNTTVFVRVENGSSSCGIDAEVKYTVNPTPQLTATPLTTTVPGFNISCNGNTDGQINVSAIFGTGHTFSKDGVSYIPAVTFSSLGAGTYTIHTRNAEGCEDATTVTLVEPPVVTFTTSAVNASCFNDPVPDGEVVVTGAGGAGSLNYFLLQDPSNTSGQLTGTFTGLRAGSYSVRVEDGNGCSKVTPAIAVGQPPELKLTIDITSNFNGHDVSCTGAMDGEISVITIAGGTPGGSGYSYTLDQDPLNLTGQTSGVFTGLRANDAATPLYTITVTDENGCSKTSLPVFLLDPIPLFPGVVGFDKNVCAGGDATPFQVLAAPFGGVGNYTYQWEESTDNINFTAVALGTDAVFDPPALTDTTYYRRRVFSGSCAGEITDTVKVVINPLPVATFSPSKSPVCEGDFFTLDFDFQTGTAPYTFEYNDGGATISRIGADQTPVPILNYVTEKTYTLTRVRDFYGCEPLTLPAPVTVPIIKLNPNFTITGPVAQCSGGTFQFEWTVDPDVDYVWIWNDGDYDTIPANSRPTGINQITHDFFSPNTSGDLKIPVFLSAKSSISSCGPVQSKKDVTIFPAIFANVFNIKTEICSEEEVEFTNLTRGGTSHRWFYRRLGVNEVLEERIFSAPTSQVYTLSNTTTSNPLIYEIVYQVSNANCNAEVIMRDTVYRSMQAAFDTLAVSKYVGGNAFASFINMSTPASDPEFRYEWEFGNGSTPSVHSGYAPPNPVQYNAVGDKDVRLTVTNIVAETNGLTCFNVEAQTIKILMPPLLADFRYTPQAACFPADISITQNLATGDFYQWTLKRNGETLLVSNDSLPTFRIVNSGEYVIELFTRNSITGQTAEADNEDSPVRIVDIPFAAFETRPEVVFAPDADGIQMYNGSSGANEYFWDFDNSGDTSTEFEPKYFYQQEGRYTIRLVASANYGAMDTDGDGIVAPGEFLICRDTAESVVLAKEGGLIKIPNAFTPSAGGPTGGTPSVTGRNDVFLPVMKGIEEFQMQIFDRWGTLIFESRDKNQGWDGYDKNGQLLPSGVYVYKLTLRLSNDQRTTQVGDVTLIR